MIGVVGKDRTCPPKLFGEHRPGHQMRPGRLAERYRQVRAAPFFGRQAIGSTDQKANFANALILPVADLLRQFDGAELFAGFIQRDDFGCRGKGRDLAASIGKLGQTNGPADALDITIDKLGLWSAADFPAGDNVKREAQLSSSAALSSPSAGSPKPHMRSRL